MILNDEQLAALKGYLPPVPQLLDTVADLQRQLAEHEASVATAMRILLEGQPGAAQNAVREDYPWMAALLDAYVQQRVDEAVREAMCLRCDICRAAEESGSRWSRANSNGKHFVIKVGDSEEGAEHYCEAYPIVILRSAARSRVQGKPEATCTCTQLRDCADHPAGTIRRSTCPIHGSKGKPVTPTQPANEGK